jgi:aryl-alcohol dehydrogenase-like predicted oxidoreductase
MDANRVENRGHDGENSLNRRDAIRAGAGLLLAGAMPRGEARAQDAPAPAASADTVEWKNRQSGMSYRRLGRTNLMVSEVVSGGDPITSDNYEHLNLALEMGLNYLDMAPAYHKGDTEVAYGKLIGGASSRRDKVILTTKVSGFSQRREAMYQDIFKGLPATKQEALTKKAQQLRDDRGVEKPGYYLTYFPGQARQFPTAYLAAVMQKEFGAKVEGSPELRRFLVESLEGSLKRVGTDHFDNLMCPHGAATPEELDCPEILATFEQLKKQGKVRFLGVTAHNDPGGVLRKAAELGHYDLAMVAYNVINGGYVHDAIRLAHEKNMGVIAMKAAMAVATHHKALQPVPDWRVAAVNRVVPGDLKPPLKAYIWSLQNPGIAAVCSNLWDETHVRENLGVAGKKVELQSA